MGVKNRSKPGPASSSRVNAIILAGGKNIRMQGEDKAFLEIEGKPIIAGVIGKLKPLVSKIIVVTNSPEKYRGFEVETVRDEHPGQGPLMGILSGLKASSRQYNFVTACDMPFINPCLIKFMLEERDDYDIFIPRVSEKFHTLLGVYSKACIPVMEEMIKKDELRVRCIFPKLNVHFLSRQEIEKIDPGLFSLVNINRPEELVGINHPCKGKP